MDDMFGLPSFDETPEFKTGACPAGQYDFTVTTSEFTKSKNSGNPMIVMEFTVDNGPESGHKVKEYFVFANTNGRNYGAERLKSLFGGAGFAWRKTQDMSEEEFAAQFVGVRFNASVSNSYSIMDGNTWKDTSSKEEFDNHEGNKNDKANLNFRKKIGPALAPAALTFGSAAPAEQKKVEIDDMF